MKWFKKWLGSCSRPLNTPSVDVDYNTELPMCVDFDGVVKMYLKGWNYGDIAGADPEPGALESLRILMRYRPVIILTARDPAQVVAWFAERGFSCTTEFSGKTWNRLGVLLVTNHKHNASVYIDDRAIRFTSWSQTLSDLEEYGLIPARQRR